ncbi:MAG: 16S rRNA (adenine(1518)-N(6)/adenine(1519)-N(6))-dimethyltransferase RsmA [Chthoniobacterales bacterium]|nr:16S rRNA (adenine(1518)-N(6)/adenine(1519)-N(6))-dimethyltransferase RsmA [Chthoniobacterales bacterium]
MSKANLLTRLKELGVRPSKMLGQNFLLDPNLAQAIVASIEPRSGDHVVEIGPGMGALTQHLVNSPASRITLLERDHRFVEELKNRYENDRVRVVGGDAAKIDLRQLYGWGPIKVIGNLPYSASTAIIAHFTEALSPACQLVFMLQREVAERLVATPGNQNYAALTILLGRRWSVKKQRVVPPEVFWPRPHVESAIVEIKPRVVSELVPCDEVEFKKAVQLGFSSRRKKLVSLLKKNYPAALEILEKLGHSPTVRAEGLGLEEWSLLSRQLSPPPRSSLQELADVVDATDSLVEVLEREIIHANKLRHRAVHILIFNKKRELFLQKRSFWKENHPGLWCSSVAGHVVAGESYLAAAQRELQEELRISTSLTPFGRFEASPLTGEEFIECFYGGSEGPFTMDPYELETGAFFSLSTIRDWLERYPEEFTPVFKLLAERFNVQEIAQSEPR